MAQVYAGNPAKIDSEILMAVKQLPDDFAVFAEFDIERNIDWFIIHLRPTGPASLILTELKRTTKRLRGDVNGQWEESSGGNQWTPMLSAGREINPYQQATAAANSMKEWLWGHQRFFLDDDQERSEDAFRVWPDLLILGPEGISPILPMRPTSRFGLWFFSVDPWVTHLGNWRALPGGVTLTDTGVRRIAEQLRLTPIWPDKQPVRAEEQRPIDLPAIATRLLLLENRVTQLEADLKGRPQRRLPRPATSPKPLSEAEASALVSAVTTAKLTGKSRGVPTIISYMDRELGYRLKDTAYNGRGTATALMEQARADGLIVFGPKTGPNATLYLPGEDVPAT